MKAPLVNDYHGKAKGGGLTPTFMMWHKWFMFIAWGILIDISLIIARNFKMWTHYMIIHGLLMIVIDFGTIVLVSMTLYYNRAALSTINYYFFFNY